MSDNMEQHRRPNQCQRIISYLMQFGSITALEALQDLGVFRLGTRIAELRHKLGYNIVGKWQPIKNRYGEKVKIMRYSIAKEKAQ